MDIKKRINELIEGQQYALKTEEKQKIILPVIIEQINQQKKEKHLAKFYEQLTPPSGIKNLKDIPPIPISFFKNYDLRLTPPEKIVRILTSSGTTSQKRSKIHLDKETAFRQSRALSSILKSYIGNQRKPMVIIDTEEVNKPKNHDIGARGAAIRGLTQFGKDITYILEGKEELKLNFSKFMNFIKKYSGQEIILFGFTYIIWTIFYKELKRLNANVKINAVLIHSGGWKKLSEQQVNKEFFDNKLAKTLGIKTKNIKDMYGLVEQVGIVFIDCEFGNKHTPNFAEIIIRNPLTMEEVNIEETGLIEILSILPESYPGQAVITEDLGLFCGTDDCKCGRKGKYFKFVSRVEKSEIRGCGDTFSGGENDTVIF